MMMMAAPLLLVEIMFTIVLVEMMMMMTKCEGLVGCFLAHINISGLLTDCRRADCHFHLYYRHEPGLARLCKTMNFDISDEHNKKGFIVICRAR